MNFPPKPSQAKCNFLILFLFLSIPQNLHANLREGLVGWWKLDEASGNAIDSSGQGKTGTPTGTTTVSNCKRSGCRSFNGTSDRITSSSFTGLGSSNRSVSVWFNVTGGSGSRRVITLPADATATDAAAMIISVNLTTVGVGFGGSPWDCYVGTTSIPNTWTHVVGTISGNQLIMYINGVSVDSCTNSGAVGANPIGEIGRYNASYGQYFQGQIDDVRIYNRALTAQEVRELYIPGIVLRNGVVRNGRINQ